MTYSCPEKVQEQRCRSMLLWPVRKQSIRLWLCTAADGHSGLKPSDLS